MLFPVVRLEKFVITSIKREIAYLEACTAFNEFTDKGKFVVGLKLLKMESMYAFVSKGPTIPVLWLLESLHFYSD